MFIRGVLILGIFFFLSGCDEDSSSPVEKKAEIAEVTEKEINLTPQKKQTKFSFVKTENKIIELDPETNEYPDEIFGDIMHEYTGYVIQKDKKGEILSISVSPVSMSGDWFKEIKYSFDENGKISKIQITDNTFNPGDEINNRREQINNQEGREETLGQISLDVFYDKKGEWIKENLKTNYIRKISSKDYEEKLYKSVKNLIDKEKIQDIIKKTENKN